MMLASGKVEYSLGCPPVTGRGISWSAEELDTALAGPVAQVVFDDAGGADLAVLLSGLPDTAFDPTAIRGVFSRTNAPKDWRVGEALAESYLVHHRCCHFPWPVARDERKTGSSLPGADLVGFQNDGVADRFAFGEVKTSSENRYPPGAMHGQKGLKRQIEGLRDKPAFRDDLVKYLGHRARNEPWHAKYRRAVIRYLRDSNDVCVFGVLVRDVAPHQDDLRVRVRKLGDVCPPNMVMELLAVYLPDGSISTLSEKVVRFREGGAA
jgi:hypothetical protein